MHQQIESPGEQQQRVSARQSKDSGIPGQSRFSVTAGPTRELSTTSGSLCSPFFYIPNL